MSVGIRPVPAWHKVIGKQVSERKPAGSQPHVLRIDPVTARPAAYTGLGAEIARLLGATFLKLMGWKIQGDWPGLDKAVLVAAPHTSNWDGLYMFAVAARYRIRLSWMGKKSLTAGPFGWVVRAAGCVPIDRSAAHGVVDAMVEAFASRDRLILLVPPEGTRSLTPVWKTGFYNIAAQAGVPLLLAIPDFGTKTFSFAAVITPTGDYETDLPVIQSFYQGVKGLRPDKFVAAG